MTGESRPFASGVNSGLENGIMYRRKAEERRGNGWTDRKSESPEDSEDDLESIIRKTSTLKISLQQERSKISSRFVRVINPLILTILSSIVRLYRIDASPSVVWDEAHFGKFGSYYLKRSFYFDVHPPLGKLLVALSGYLAGYDGSFDFESSIDYPENCDYVMMRCFNCIFGILCTPVAYKTAVAMGFSQWTVWLISLLVVFEMMSLTLSKFILLDSFLLFFTVLCFYCLVNLHHLRVSNKLLTFKGLFWLSFTGFSIGCVCSVKWVGLFVTALIGLYVIYDLMIRTYQLISRNQKTSFTSYLAHWISRIFTLIIIPFTVYLVCFKIHFMVLKRSGEGDGSVSTLLQATFEDTKLLDGPRTVAYGSMVTLRSQGLSPNLLHSHPHLYPEGSQQQQITTYGYKDENNNFLIEFDLESGLRGEYATYENDENSTVDHRRPVKDGDVVRLVHNDSGCLLHSHPIKAPILKSAYEVSCYSDLEHSDEKDEWIVEILKQEVSPDPFFQSEAQDELHPISTNFRLKHKVLGCYLTTTGYALPSWGYKQGEVVCKFAIFSQDKSTWWNVEDHINSALPLPEKEYVPPKPRFWKEFILLNYAMMASNNALLPDYDKFDRLSSEWWEWPILHSGLRMCGWAASEVKFFLIGNPPVTWFSTLALIIFAIYSLALLLCYRRQTLVFPGGVFDEKWNKFILQGIFPFLGWLLHYLPFVVMGRVKYLHHYVPAQYFAIFVSGFIMEVSLRRINRHLSHLIYLVSYVMIIGVFWKLRPLCFGMNLHSLNYGHLRVLETWMV